MYWYYIECNLDFLCVDWFYFDRWFDIKMYVYYYRLEVVNRLNIDFWVFWIDGGFIERGRIECRIG